MIEYSRLVKGWYLGKGKSGDVAYFDGSIFNVLFVSDEEGSEPVLCREAHYDDPSITNGTFKPLVLILPGNRMWDAGKHFADEVGIDFDQVTAL